MAGRSGERGVLAFVLLAACVAALSGPAFSLCVGPPRTPSAAPNRLGGAGHRGPLNIGTTRQSAGPALVAAALAASAALAAAARRAEAPRTQCRASGRDEVSRRGGAFAALVPLGLAAAPCEPASAAGKVSAEALSKAKADIEKLIKADPNKGPTLVRLAWHSAGTYDKMSKTGGSGMGTIRFKEELAHGGNAGLDKAVAWMEPLKQANASLSYADLYTLGGIVAIQTLGGPQVPWRAGRVDSMSPSDVTPDGRLPNADNGSSDKDSSHLRDIFGRMGFNDQEIVALSGAHALGRCHADASGFVGPWTPTPTMFNNLYFTLLKTAMWEEGCINGETCKNKQYRDTNTKNLMMLPTDIALIKDPSFKKYVDAYADDQKLFFTDFSKAFSTLLELGTKDLYTV